jgi:hypothetical protein
MSAQITNPSNPPMHIKSTGSTNLNSMNFSSTPIIFNGMGYINACYFDGCNITIKAPAGGVVFTNNIITNSKGAGINIVSLPEEKKYEFYDWIRLQIGTLAELEKSGGWYNAIH